LKKEVISLIIENDSHLKNYHDIKTVISRPISVIKTLTNNTQFNDRLKALGVKKDNIVEIIRQAKFDGPFHLKIGTTEFMLRSDIAAQIDIEIITPKAA